MLLSHTRSSPVADSVDLYSVEEFSPAFDCSPKGDLDVMRHSFPGGNLRFRRLAMIGNGDAVPRPERGKGTAFRRRAE